MESRVLEADLIVQSGLPACMGAAADRYLMDRVRQGRRSVLRVSQGEGRALSLGRYHLAPKSISRLDPVEVSRRVCGGRVRPAGAGYLTISLVLPHRSSLVGDDPYALTPTQALNRFVRGLLDAFRQIGIPAYYPGRDLLTVDRSIFAMVALECGAGGVTLLEAQIANEQDLVSGPDLLEAVDPDGDVAVELWAPEATTSIRRRLHRVVEVEEMAVSVSRAYERQFPTCFRNSILSSTETKAIQDEAASTTDTWLASRRKMPGLTRHVISPAQVGMLEAYFSPADGRRIDSILFAGDFIANSHAVDELEQRLRGCPLQADAIDRVVRGIFEDRDNFILGIGKLNAISQLLVAGHEG